MKQRKGLRIFAVFMLVLTLLAFSLPAGPVAAVGVMTLSPTFGPAGTQVTITVTGIEAPYREVELYAYFDSTPATLAMSNDFGVFTAPYTIPSGATAGTHTFRLQTNATYSVGTTLASANFTVGTSAGSSTLTLLPAAGLAGSSVTVSGSGLAAYLSTTRYLYWDSTLAAVINVNAAGAYSSSFVVPGTATAGVHTVTLRETSSSSSALIASGTYTVTGGTTTAALALSSTSGLPGNVLTASGTLADYADFELFLFFDTTYRSAVTLTSGGVFSGTLTAPLGSTVGSHTVTLRTEAGYASGIAVATATYTVTAGATASITVTPATGKAGDIMTLNGTFFTAFIGLTFTLDNVPLTLLGTSPPAPNSAGAFSTTFRVPTLAAGSHTLRVVDTSGKSATTTFTTTIPLTTEISPATGLSGDTVTLTGGGYTAGRAVSVTFDGVAVSAAAIVQTNGNFSVSFVVPPNIASGTYAVVVTDGIFQGSLIFTTAATISLDKTAVAIGDQVTVIGTGFNASEPVTITLNGIQLAVVPETSASGEFSTAITVPSLPIGSYQIEVRDASNTLSADVSISASMSLDSATGAVGATVTVSGQGFSGTVQVGYDGVEVATATVTGGTFTASFKVPVSKAGEHPIVVTDGTNSMNASFTVESDPPTAPAAVSPEPEAKAGKTIEFDWADVTDASGVTYQLQVSTDAQFSVIVLEKMDLSDSIYQLLDEEQLTALDKDAAYYWRVRALDSAENVGAWSSPQTFAVAGFRVGPIGMWVGVGAGMVLMLMLGFWLGRRTAYY